MKITFCGAAREVTGSNFLVEAAGKKFLVDCGLIQGRMSDAERNYDDFIYNPQDIDFMLLTHAHVDHSGRIPKLVKEGFKGDIYATKATIELSEIMLLDTAHIQETEVEWKNEKRRKKGEVELDPLFTIEDAKDCMVQFKEIEYMDIVEIDENIRVRYNEAGHMLGSAIIEVWVTENGKTTKTVFTGDLGNNVSTILEPAMPIISADYLVMESTYGSRNHVGQEDNETKARNFIDIVAKTLKRGGNVVIPSFAVGRTQEIIYEINKIKDRLDCKLQRDQKFLEQIELIENTKVFVDSPLAIKATEIFAKNINLLDEESRLRTKRGDDIFEFAGLKFTVTPDESKAINFEEEPVIIISASGMCDAGRIKHHLVNNLWNPKNTILFVGYQATNTLGRRLVDGEKQVKIFGEDITVNAEIEYIEGYSGHADQTWLMNFVYSFREKPKAIFLVHGEEESQLVLKAKIEEEIGITTYMPYYGDKYNISEIVVHEGKLNKKGPERLRKKKLVFADRLNELSGVVNRMSGEVENSIIGETVTDETKDVASEKQIDMLYHLVDKLDVFKVEILNLIENVKLGTGNNDEKIVGDIFKRHYPLIIGQDKEGNLVIDKDGSKEFFEYQKEKQRLKEELEKEKLKSKENKPKTKNIKEQENNFKDDETKDSLKKEVSKLEKEIEDLEKELANANSDKKNK